MGRRGIGAAFPCIQKSGRAAAGAVGLARHQCCEGGWGIAGSRQVQLNGTADPLPAAPHRYRVYGQLKGDIDQNQLASRLTGFRVGPERMRIGGVEDRLHRPPPILEVGRSSQQRGVVDGLFFSGELPLAYSHLVLKFDDAPEQVCRSLGAQAGNKKKKTLNRLAFVGKEIIPPAELLIHEGEKGQRYALEQSLAQCILKNHRQCQLALHTLIPAQTSRSTRLKLKPASHESRQAFGLAHPAAGNPAGSPGWDKDRCDEWGARLFEACLRPRPGPSSRYLVLNRYWRDD